MRRCRAKAWPFSNRGVCYRAHDPRWSFKPISGAGAAIRGARFNPTGVPALYLALGIVTAVKEANQGFAHRIDPCVLCSYETDCEDIVDLRGGQDRDSAGVALDDLECPWMDFIGRKRRPPSWAIYDRLSAARAAGILVPSFAPGAEASDQNLVLWKWGFDLPHSVRVFDPSGRLPRNQLSWDRASIGSRPQQARRGAGRPRTRAIALSGPSQPFRDLA